MQGIVKDKAREQLSPAELYILKNARPYRGKLQASPGLSSLSASVLTGTPNKAFYWEGDDESRHFNICTQTKIYAYNYSTGLFTDITWITGPYTGSALQFWDACAYNAQVLLTNRADSIQMWDGIATNAVALGGTPPKARAIASFQTYVVLGDVSTGSIRTVQWSDTGNAAAWTGGDSGFFNLFQDPGPIYRLLPLGEVLVAYRKDSIHIIFYVGAPFIFGQRQLFSNGGLIGPRAVADLGDRHIYWARDNVYLFDGVNRTPIADDIISTMLGSIDGDNANYTLAFTDYLDREVYFVYCPVGSGGVLSAAWVYNYQLGTWRQEDISVTAGSYARFPSVVNTWNSILGTWDGQTLVWNDLASGGLLPTLTLATAAGAVLKLDKSTVDVVGVGRERIAETGLFDPGAQLFQSPGSFCTLEQVEVECESQGSYNLEVWIGTQNQLTGDGAITWTRYTLILDGSQRFIPINRTARYFAVRFRTTGSGQTFRISGLVAHFNQRGNR